MLYASLILSLICTAHASYIVREIYSPTEVIQKQIIMSKQEVKKPIVLRNIPFQLDEKEIFSHHRFKETLFPGFPLTTGFSQVLETEQDPFPGHEVRTLIKQGPDANRIVITILGDGYTAAEKEKYFTDVQKIVSNIFEGKTFKSYLPFLNVYAVFVPSEESGLSDHQEVNTAFGLHRWPVGSKRAILPPENTDTIEAALNLAPAPAAYPIIIANDAYYGGLGGRYAITTSSVRSASIVLRHELGHNFSNVGEEYDGGSVYDGANFSTTPSGKWDHWKLGNPNESQESEQIFGAYIWKPLSEAFVQDFKTTDSNSLFTVQISSVGWEKKGDVEILLDGQQLELTGEYTQDRSFFDTVPFKVKRGTHQLVIRSNGDNPAHVLAFANGYTFPMNYDFNSNEVKAFSVFNEDMTKVGYRPTEHMCVMRDMLSEVFCPVDQESIWLQFLQRVSLIDSVETVGGSMRVNTIPFDASLLEVSWITENKELVQYRNQLTVPVSGAKLKGLKVRVKLKTPEVRLNSPHLVDEVSL